MKQEYRIERCRYSGIEACESKYMNRFPEELELCCEDSEIVATFSSENTAVKAFAEYSSDLSEYCGGCELTVYELMEYLIDEDGDIDSCRLIAKSKLDEETSLELDVKYGYYQYDCIADMSIAARRNYIKYELYVTRWYDDNEEERYDVNDKKGLSEQELEAYLTEYAEE